MVGPRVNPGSPSRRAVFAALAAAPLAFTVSSSSGATVTADASAWSAALVRFEKAKKRRETTSAIWDRVYAAYQAEVPDYLTAIDWSGLPFADKARIAHSADIDLMEAQWLASEGKIWSAQDRDAVIAKQRSCFDSVRRYRRDRAECDWRHDWDSVNDRDEAASIALDRAEAELLNLPAPNSAGLLLKLDLLFGEDTRLKHDGVPGWDEAIIDLALRDARRLMAKIPTDLA